MKIYTRLVISMDSGAVLESDAYEYDGPVAMAMPSLGGSDPDSGGDDPSGGASGGSGSGASGSGGGDSGGSYGTGGKRAGADSAGAVGDESSDDGGWSGAGRNEGADGLASERNAARDRWNKIEAGALKVKKWADYVGMFFPPAKLVEYAALGVAGMMYAARQVSYMIDEPMPDFDFSGIPEDADLSSFVRGSLMEGVPSMGAEKTPYASSGASMPAASEAMPQAATEGALNAPSETSQALNDDWTQFEQMYTEMGQSLLNAYQNVLGDYEKNINSIPGLNVIIPDHMGGGSLAIAPGKWTQVYGQQADMKKDLIDSGAALMPQMAEAQSTGIANRQNQYQFDRNQELQKALANMGIEGNLAQINAQQPSDLAVWAPVAVDAVEAASEVDWGEVGEDLGDFWDWLST